MKKNIKYFGLILTVAVAGSCDFLEAPPSTDLNEDSVFADRSLCEQFITGIYA